jgi:hypothetical protein
MIEIAQVFWNKAFGTNHQLLGAVVYCPKCDRPLSLLKHRIAEDGTVSPSVVCSWEGCNFHEHIKLVGWNQ